MIVTQIVIQRQLWVHNLIMGVYAVMGAKCFDKNGLKIKSVLKMPIISSVKCTKFDNFYKNHGSMVDPMSRQYFVSSTTF